LFASYLVSYEEKGIWERNWKIDPLDQTASDPLVR
jgi:hypothetical protein